MCSKLKSPEEFKSLLEVTNYFKDEKTCLAYLEQWLWGGEMKCPNPECELDCFYRYKDGKRLKCKVCKTYFTAKVGTIFENSKLPMRKWFIAMYLVSANKKGVNSCQLARTIGVTQKTAWFMAHRIRNAMKQTPKKLTGVIEVDEAFVGGKNKNRHIDKKRIYREGRNYIDKTPVLGLVQRGGIVKTIVVKDTSAASIRPLLKKHIEPGSTIYSDEWGGYKYLSRSFNHGRVDHSKKQFRNGEACTNKVENFWSHLKRMIIGVYIQVSPKHLQMYADELTFRFNSRSMKDGERLKVLFSNLRNPLKYKQLISCYA